jgi:hypothetical protein
MPFAEDERSVIALAQFLGYKPKVTSPAITTLSVYPQNPKTPKPHRLIKMMVNINQVVSRIYYWY